MCEEASVRRPVLEVEPIGLSRRSVSWTCGGDNLPCSFAGKSCSLDLLQISRGLRAAACCAVLNGELGRVRRCHLPLLKAEALAGRSHVANQNDVTLGEIILRLESHNILSASVGRTAP